LLKTYTEERRPNVVATTRLAKEFGKIISERDPEKARARDQGIFADNQGSARTVIRQDLIPPLKAGCMVPDAPLAGKAFPQPLVDTTDAAGVLMDDLFDPCFRLVLLADSLTPFELAQVVDEARGHGIRVVLIRSALSGTQAGSHVCEVLESRGLIQHWLHQGQTIAALVRPDHYVYAGLPHASAIREGMDRLAAQWSLSSFASVSPLPKETT
jgi:3-(3-hydroxy-phenyl)propionate hydroxylase